MIMVTKVDILTQKPQLIKAGTEDTEDCKRPELEKGKNSKSARTGEIPELGKTKLNWNKPEQDKNPELELEKPKLEKTNRTPNTRTCKKTVKARTGNTRTGKKHIKQ